MTIRRSQQHVEQQRQQQQQSHVTTQQRGNCTASLTKVPTNKENNPRLFRHGSVCTDRPRNCPVLKPNPPILYSTKPCSPAMPCLSGGHATSLLNNGMTRALSFFFPDSHGSGFDSGHDMPHPLTFSQSFDEGRIQMLACGRGGSDRKISDPRPQL